MYICSFYIDFVTYFLDIHVLTNKGDMANICT